MAQGSFAYENWLCYLNRFQQLGGMEVSVFTDTHITGHIDAGFGPYQLLNTLSFARTPDITPAIILRVWDHVPRDGTSSMDKTNIDRFHGGTLADEIAAIASLCLGIRLQIGGQTRQLGDWADDPLGKPMYFGSREINLPSSRRSRVILPLVPKQVNLNTGCQLLRTLPSIAPEDSVILTRSAISYAEALTVAEVDPGLAWLLLISSVEAAASQWKKGDATPMEKIESSRPKLLSMLREKGDSNWVQAIAEQLAPYMGATRTFCDFLLKFATTPPTPRSGPCHINWDTKTLKSAYGIIYKWRSRALHGGIPFPPPMCDPPIQFEGKYSEKPFGLASATLGGTWLAKDTPMLLHLFEYIARTAILQWWRSLVQQDSLAYSLHLDPQRQSCDANANWFDAEAILAT